MPPLPSTAALLKAGLMLVPASTPSQALASPSKF